MNASIFSHEPALRFGAAVTVFAVMALWELLAARRELTALKRRRWFANLGMMVLDTLIVRFLFPTAAVGMAWAAAEQGWGLLNHVALPFWLAVAGSVALLDLGIYLQHVMFHAVPALWRIHRVHHTDLDLDVSSGVRFHPVEIVLSMVIKLGLVAALGPPALAVLIFEVVLNATSMFNHSNVRIPFGVDKVLRWLVVTPDMHRVHHSIELGETHSNFGFNLPWWDRLMGTYRDQPAAGHLGMALGVDEFRKPEQQTLPWLLGLPFFGGTRGSALGRRETAGAPRDRADD